MSRNAIIVDLDGTLVNNSVRTRHLDSSQVRDWTEFNKALQFDELSEWCNQLVRGMADRGTHIIFLTARSGSSETRQITENWLRLNMGGLNGDYTLLMRDDGDARPDFAIKQEIYMLKVAPYYNVLFAIDDKASVCNMWRSLGVTALHCEDY